MPSLTVGTTNVDVVGANAARMTLIFTNKSTGGQVIYIDNVAAGGVTTTNAGYVLSPGQSIGVSVLEDGEDIKQPWSAIADGAGGLLFWKETAQRR